MLICCDTSYMSQFASTAHNCARVSPRRQNVSRNDLGEGKVNVTQPPRCLYQWNINAYLYNVYLLHIFQLINVYTILRRKKATLKSINDNDPSKWTAAEEEVV